MGSLRNPAAWNNVFGFRPSQGRVPSHPARDQFISQMSTEGAMGRSIIDVAMLLGTQAGYDRQAPLSLDGSLTLLSDVASARATVEAFDPRSTRVGWLADLDGNLAMETGILDVCAEGLGRMRDIGCRVEPARLRFPMDELWDAWLTLRHVNAAGGIGPVITNVITDEGRRGLVKPEVLWEIDRARALTVDDVNRATEVRTRYFLAITALYDEYDVLVLPSAQVWPFPIEERWPQRIGDRTMDTYHRWMEVSIPATFAGLPAIGVPVGFDDRGLPMGMQLIGPPRADVDVLRLAHAYESTTGHLRIGLA
jgi:amidase